jgi:hypothetical protein
MLNTTQSVGSCTSSPASFPFLFISKGIHWSRVLVSPCSLYSFSLQLDDYLSV